MLWLRRTAGPERTKARSPGGPEEAPENEPHAYRYAPWRQLILAATVLTKGTARSAGDLRARQITEALRALKEHHLVSIPRELGGQ